MASTIKIKRSTTSGAPGSLADGELAYSGLTGTLSNGGDRLYVGIGGVVTKIGGKYFTDMMDHTPGTLTASSALIVDSNSKINVLNVDKLGLSTNIITTTDTNTNLIFDANGTGLIQVYPGNVNSFTLPRSRGTSGYVLTVGDNGVTSWEPAAAALTITTQNNTGGDNTINLLNDTLTINGATGITTALAADVLTITGVAATTSALGVASFNGTDFSVSAGAVSLSQERIEDIASDLIKNGTNQNISITYTDNSTGAGVMNFVVTTASTSVSGVARFDSNYFNFGTGGDEDKVSLNTNLVNSVTAGGSALTIDANSLTVVAGASSGVTVAGAGSTITVSGITATKNVKGVAQFSAAYFNVSSGDVSIGTSTAGSDTGGGAAAAGLARFDSTYFDVSANGFVQSKKFTIGAQDINLGSAAVTQLTGMTLFEVGDLRLQNGTVSGTGTNTDVKLKPTGSGKVYIDSETVDAFWYLPTSRGTGVATNEVLTINKITGEASWVAPASNVTIYDNTGTVNQILTVGADSLDIRGTRGIGTAVTSENGGAKVVVTVSGTYATSSTVGVASFNATEFTVNGDTGAVTLTAGGIDKSKLTQNTVQIGNTSVSLGSSASNFTGLDSTEIGNISIGAVDGAGTIPRSTVTTLAQNSNLYISGNGNGNVWISGAYSLPRVDGLNGQSLITNGSGTLSWSTPTTILQFQADETNDSTNVLGSVDLLNDTLNFIGGRGIATVINDAGNTLTIRADLAAYSSGGDTSLGVASFAQTFFTVTSGAVTLADAGVGTGITNAKLVNSKVTIGTTDVSLGAQVKTFVGLEGITSGNLSLGANTTTNSIVATNTGGGISLETDGSGPITFYGQGGNSWTIPQSRGTNGYVLTTNGSGAATWAAAAAALTIAGDSGSDNPVQLLSEKLTIAGGVGLSTTASANTITVDADLATSSTVGVASFSDTYFSVDGAGAVTLTTEGVEDIVGAMVSNGSVKTYITVAYNDTTNKFDFAVPPASTSDVGVAKYYAGDFEVDSSHEVTLAASVLKSFTVDNGAISPSNHSISLVGTSARGIKVTQSTGTITVSADIATSSSLGVAKFAGAGLNIDGAGEVTLSLATSSTTKGIASFASGNFTVTDGAVAAKTQTLGDQTISLGGTAITAINGLTQLTAGKLLLSNSSNTSTIEYSGAEADGNINLKPKGAGVIDTNGFEITGLPLSPSNNPTAAVSKAYADSLRSGLTIKDPVRVATHPNATNDNGVDPDGTIDLTYTGSDAPKIDGITLASGDRVLVKNQEQIADEDSTESVENGIWVWTLGVGTSAWARAADVNSIGEMVSGMFTFVQEGDTWGDCGWLLQTDYGPGATLWTSGAHGSYQAWKFLQFSSAGVITVNASSGISKSGNLLSVNVGDGIEKSANAITLKSTVAGAGLTYTSGVVAVGGTTDRISINADSIDISASYVGQSSITTLGTIATGVWNGTTIAVNKGGTGLTTYNRGALLVGTSGNSLAALAVGAAGKFLQVNDDGNDLVYGDIDGGTY